MQYNIGQYNAKTEPTQTKKFHLKPIQTTILRYKLLSTKNQLINRNLYLIWFDFQLTNTFLVDGSVSTQKQ